MLATITPARPRSRARSTAASTWAGSRSGASFTSTGRGAAPCALGLAAVGLVDRREDLAERAGRLQVAQAGGVGRADVQGHVVGVAPERRDRAGVVGRRGRGRGDLRLADVHAQRRPAQQLAPLERVELGGGGVGAGVVEAEAVDQGPVVGQAVQARARVALLGQRRDGADLGEAEAQPRPGGGGLGVLVEAGREADRVGEARPQQVLGQAAAAVRRRGDAADDRRRERQRGHRQLVGALGVEAEEQRPGDGRVEPHPARRPAGPPRPPS